MVVRRTTEKTKEAKSIWHIQRVCFAEFVTCAGSGNEHGTGHLLLCLPLHFCQATREGSKHIASLCAACYNITILKMIKAYWRVWGGGARAAARARARVCVHEKEKESIQMARKCNGRA